jgi:hypothetical protein
LCLLGVCLSLLEVGDRWRLLDGCRCLRRLKGRRLSLLGLLEGSFLSLLGVRLSLLDGPRWRRSSLLRWGLGVLGKSYPSQSH